MPTPLQVLRTPRFIFDARDFLRRKMDRSFMGSNDEEEGEEEAILRRCRTCLLNGREAATLSVNAVNV